MRGTGTGRILEAQLHRMQVVSGCHRYNASIRKGRTNAKNSNSLSPWGVDGCNIMLSSKFHMILSRWRGVYILCRWGRVSIDIHRLRKSAFKLLRSKKKR